jgi:hypothetical protein
VLNHSPGSILARCQGDPVCQGRPLRWFVWVAVTTPNAPNALGQSKGRRRIVSTSKSASPRPTTTRACSPDVWVGVPHLWFHHSHCLLPPAVRRWFAPTLLGTDLCILHGLQSRHGAGCCVITLPDNHQSQPSIECLQPIARRLRASVRRS